MSLYPKAEKIIKDFIFMLIGEHKKRIILFLYFSLYSEAENKLSAKNS